MSVLARRSVQRGKHLTYRQQRPSSQFSSAAILLGGTGRMHLAYRRCLWVVHLRRTLEMMDVVSQPHEGSKFAHGSGIPESRALRS